MTDRINHTSAGAQRVRQAPRRDDYAPYHTLDAFAEGVAAYGLERWDNPYHRPYTLGAGVNAQAWDRGLEYAMRVARFALTGK